MPFTTFWTVGYNDALIDPNGGGGGGQGNGKGRGNNGGGGGWTGGNGWHGGGKKNSGAGFTKQPEYSVVALKATGTGISGDIIAAFDNAFGNGASDFNKTTGRWTCSASGWYFVYASAYGGVGNGGSLYWRLQLYRGGSWLGAGNEGHDNQPGSVSPQHGGSAPFCRLIYMTASQYLELRQLNGIGANVRWTIIGVNTDCLFHATRATTGETRIAAETVDGYDAVTEWTGRFANYFNTTSGEFTAPVAGHYVFYCRGTDTGYTNTANTWTYLYKEGSAFQALSYTYTGARQRCQFRNGMCVIQLAKDEKVKFVTDYLALDNVSFGGWRLPDWPIATPLFMATDSDGSAGAAPGNYTGYATTVYDTASGWNGTTGVYTVQSGGAGIWFAHGTDLPYPSTSVNDLWGTDVRFNGGDYAKSVLYGATRATYPWRISSSAGAAISLSAAGTINAYQVDQAEGLAKLMGFRVVGSNST